MPAKALQDGFKNTGWTHFDKLFTPRQLVALTTFSDLVAEARERVKADALAAGMEEGQPLRDGGNGALAYAEAVGVYLGFAVEVRRQITKSRKLGITLLKSRFAQPFRQTSVTDGLGFSGG